MNRPSRPLIGHNDHAWQGGTVTTTAELTVGAATDAVPAARRFVRETLEREPEGVIEDAELVVAELVTNAILHGAPPVVLRVARSDTGVRIAVEDSGRNVPVVGRKSTTAMTGRGLALVSALTAAWGVEPGTDGGKAVWAELSADSDAGVRGSEAELDVDALLAAWVEDDVGPPTFEVRLGAVPTNLLLDAKAHIDNVVRELTLARAGETSGGAALPVQMQPLVETVLSDFAMARAEIKRQALAAAARGEPTTELTLTLPLSAADAGERYLAALDEADSYARAARLLTMAPPRSHREFRRWYVQKLVDQLRAVAAGKPPPPVVPLTESFAVEVDRLASLEDTWGRLQILQRITAELTDAASVEQIAATVVESAAANLGADTARVYLLGDDGVLRSIATHTVFEFGDAIPYSEFSIDDDLPGSVVARTRAPLYMRSLAQIADRFPAIAKFYENERSMHVAPLVVGEHVLGVLSLTFTGMLSMDEDTQISFMQALADALAQAIERAQAMGRAADAAERLAFLADASVALSASLDFEATVEAVTRLMVPRLADWCVVQLLRDGVLENASLLHYDPARVDWAIRMQDRYPVDMDAPTGAANVIRTGRSEIYPHIPEEMIDAAAVDEEHGELLRSLGLASALVVPLSGRTGTFGAITLIYAESGRHYDEADRSFVEDVARRAALALETAEMFREQSGRLATVTRVAEAAQRAILAPPPPRLGPVALAARYVSAAADALVGGDLYEVVPAEGAVRLLIGDVRGKGLTAVRTATIVLGEFRAAAADVGDLATVARLIDRRVRPHLGDEDFVTAVVAEVRDDGAFAIASCGHPAPLLIADGKATEIELEPSLPLGLGADPAVGTGRLAVGDRLFLYTDGMLEARDTRNRFVNFDEVVAPVVSTDMDSALDEVLSALHRATGPALGDDLALLIAEYRPE
jgi:serine phosphatase RsbU (regulator of sigma subunit)/anti-sigma regulatory factor (Ser/Thr protein kinase)